MGRYSEDPHQEWADEGWPDEYSDEDIAVCHDCNEECPCFEGCPFEDFEDVGLCWISPKHPKWVYRQEPGDGDCVW